MEEINTFDMATILKINIDKVTLKVLFKTIAKSNVEMNETSFVHGSTSRRLQIKSQVQAADFFTPNQSASTIVLKNTSGKLMDKGIG